MADNRDHHVECSSTSEDETMKSVEYRKQPTVTKNTPAKYPSTAYILFHNDQMKKVGSGRRPSIVTRSQSKLTNHEAPTRSGATKHKTTKFTIQSRIILSKWKKLTSRQKQEWQRRAAALSHNDSPSSSHKGPSEMRSSPETPRATNTEDRDCHTTTSDCADPPSTKKASHETTESGKERVLPRRCFV